MIQVKDNGVGIDEENLKNLFQAFKKIDSDSNRNLNKYGCGLGLKLSKYVAKAIGGDIMVES